MKFLILFIFISALQKFAFAQSDLFKDFEFESCKNNLIENILTFNDCQYQEDTIVGPGKITAKVSLLESIRKTTLAQVLTNKKINNEIIRCYEDFIKNQASPQCNEIVSNYTLRLDQKLFEIRTTLAKSKIDRRMYTAPGRPVDFKDPKVQKMLSLQRQSKPEKKKEVFRGIVSDMDLEQKKELYKSLSSSEDIPKDTKELEKALDDKINVSDVEFINRYTKKLLKDSAKDYTQLSDKSKRVLLNKIAHYEIEHKVDDASEIVPLTSEEMDSIFQDYFDWFDGESNASFRSPEALHTAEVYSNLKQSYVDKGEEVPQKLLDYYKDEFNRSRMYHMNREWQKYLLSQTKDYKEKYIQLLSENPELVFIKEASVSNRPEIIIEALKKQNQLLDQTAGEFKKMDVVNDDHDDLVMYFPMAERILSESPQYCSLAQEILDDINFYENLKIGGLITGSILTCVFLRPIGCFAFSSISASDVALTSLGKYDKKSVEILLNNTEASKVTSNDPNGAIIHPTDLTDAELEKNIAIATLPLSFLSAGGISRFASSRKWHDAAENYMGEVFKSKGARIFVKDGRYSSSKSYLPGKESKSFYVEEVIDGKKRIFIREADHLDYREVRGGFFLKGRGEYNIISFDQNILQSPIRASAKLLTPKLSLTKRLKAYAKSSSKKSLVDVAKQAARRYKSGDIYEVAPIQILGAKFYNKFFKANSKLSRSVTGIPNMIVQGLPLITLSHFVIAPAFKEAMEYANSDDNEESKKLTEKFLHDYRFRKLAENFSETCEKDTNSYYEKENNKDELSLMLRPEAFLFTTLAQQDVNYSDAIFTYALASIVDSSEYRSNIIEKIISHVESKSKQSYQDLRNQISSLSEEDESEKYETIADSLKDVILKIDPNEFLNDVVAPLVTDDFAKLQTLHDELNSLDANNVSSCVGLDLAETTISQYINSSNKFNSEFTRTIEVREVVDRDKFVELVSNGDIFSDHMDPLFTQSLNLLDVILFSEELSDKVEVKNGHMLLNDEEAKIQMYYNNYVRQVFYSSLNDKHLSGIFEGKSPSLLVNLPDDALANQFFKTGKLQQILDKHSNYISKFNKLSPSSKKEAFFSEGFQKIKYEIFEAYDDFQFEKQKELLGIKFFDKEFEEMVKSGSDLTI